MSQALLDTPVLTGRWAVDTTHSWVGFEVSHMVVSRFRGEIRDFVASLDASDGTPVLTGTGRVESIVTRDDNLTGHLRSPEFFDAERHPELRVVSTGFEIDGERVRIPAELTVKGITKAVVLEGTAAGPIADPYGNGRIGLDLETTVDRRDFALEWNVPLPGGGLALGHDVKLFARLELVQEG
jgi:polyisoprenoid-binding protein YceI